MALFELLGYSEKLLQNLKLTSSIVGKIITSLKNATSNIILP